MIAANRTDCEDKCLNEFTFVCRSATYDSASKTCWLSRFTRRSHPELLEEDPSSDYLENTCLNGKRIFHLRDCLLIVSYDVFIRLRKYYNQFFVYFQSKDVVMGQLYLSKRKTNGWADRSRWTFLPIYR